MIASSWSSSGRCPQGALHSLGGALRGPAMACLCEDPEGLAALALPCVVTLSLSVARGHSFLQTP